MKNRERILLGAAGAVMPIVVSVYFSVGHMQSVAFNAIAFTVQLLILILVGAFIGYLHTSETDKFKMFQLGLAVPSLLTAIYTGQDLQQAKTNQQIEINSRTGAYAKPVPEIIEFSFPFITSAHAQSPLQTKPNYKRYSMPEQSVARSLWQGISGAAPENIWYVITSSHKDEKEAQAKADEINNMGKGFKAEVYAPYNDNPHYAVIIGANLTLDDAKKRQQQAIKEGLAKDTYLWSLK